MGRRTRLSGSTSREEAVILVISVKAKPMPASILSKTHIHRSTFRVVVTLYLHSRIIKRNDMINSELNFTLEEILPKFQKDFQEKITHSVELLRKAEKLALAYSPNEGFYLSFSSGKDSQCLYHIAKIAGVKFKAHMGLTSVDPPEVIKFCRKHYPDVDMIKPKISIYNQARKEGMLPTRLIRWCCRVYKEGIASVQGMLFSSESVTQKADSVRVGVRLRLPTISTAVPLKVLTSSVIRETARSVAVQPGGVSTRLTSPMPVTNVPLAVSEATNRSSSLQS